ncbi:MAG: SDR family oxidoreductase [Planctomycetes bacterium]|nr:SDR family oxidoreductase [Planctomycetota bacterium]
MKRELVGRRILITGASRGIGRALAKQAALQGARVAFTARTAPRLHEQAQAIVARGGEALPIPADITVAADRQRLLQTVVDHFGGLDVLINNAGIASWCHFLQSSEEVVRQILEVNFFAPAELIRLAIPLLSRGHEPAILNIASLCGRRGLPGWSEYSASKFALCGLTEALRGEMARFDISVLLVVPGLTQTDLFEHLLRSEGRAHLQHDKAMPPEWVARQILEALRHNRPEVVLGQDAVWMLRLHRFFPGLVDWLLRRHIRQLYEEPAA